MTLSHFSFNSTIIFTLSTIQNYRSKNERLKVIHKISSLSMSFIAAGIILVSSGCSENASGPSDSGNTVPPGTSLSKFSEIQSRVFTPTCAVAGCHGGSNVQANLSLSEGNAYNNLVNKQSFRNPNFVRVKPGDSGNSFLIKMLRNTGEGTTVMPPTGKLSDAVIDSIALWINNGALNN